MATATRPRVYVPGLLPQDPRRETYRVPAGETTTVRLEAGDRLTVCDPQGAQRGVVSSDELGLRSDVFGPESRPGAEETFLAERRALVAVAALPGSPVVEGGVPATDLMVEVLRVRPRDDSEAPQCREISAG